MELDTPDRIHAAQQCEVTIRRHNAKGVLTWRQTSPIKDALVTLLRYARRRPRCRIVIELYDPKPDGSAATAEAEEMLLR